MALSGAAISLVFARNTGQHDVCALRVWGVRITLWYFEVFAQRTHCWVKTISTAQLLVYSFFVSASLHFTCRFTRDTCSRTRLRSTRWRPSDCTAVRWARWSSASAAARRWPLCRSDVCASSRRRCPSGRRSPFSNFSPIMWFRQCFRSSAPYSSPRKFFGDPRTNADWAETLTSRRPSRVLPASHIERFE